MREMGYQEEPRIAVVQEDKRNIGIDLNIKTIPRYPSNDQAGSWGGVGEVKLVSAGDGAADGGADGGSAEELNRQQYSIHTVY